jgi:hypothetical protein
VDRSDLAAANNFVHFGLLLARQPRNGALTDPRLLESAKQLTDIAVG